MKQRKHRTTYGCGNALLRRPNLSYFVSLHKILTVSLLAFTLLTLTLTTSKATHRILCKPNVARIFLPRIYCDSAPSLARGIYSKLPLTK